MWSSPLQGSLGNVVQSCAQEQGEDGFWGTANGLCHRQGEQQGQRLRSGSEFGVFRVQQGRPCSWSSEMGGERVADKDGEAGKAYSQGVLPLRLALVKL